MQNVQNLFTFDNANSFRRFGVAPILVWPNLGKPAILSQPSDQLKPNQMIRLEIIAVADPYKRVDEIRKELTTAIQLIPLLGLDHNSGRAIQGVPADFIIDQVQISPFVQLNDPAVLSNYFNHSPKEREIGLGCEPLHANSLFHDFFCGKNTQLRIEGSFKLSADVSKYLQSHPFILFNLIERIPTIPDRILYHAVCLTAKTDWTNLNFFHASDLHVAKRNDDMLGIIKTRYSGSSINKMATAVDQTVDTVKNVVDQTVDTVKKALPGLLQKVKKAIPSLPIKTESNTESNTAGLNPTDFPKFPDSSESEKPEGSDLPIEERVNNPNNSLRRLIRYSNSEADAARCDFLLLTGDIIDFCVKSDNPSEQPNFDFDHTNWERFLEIVLNLPISPRSGYPLTGIESNQELLVPIFTMLGNHDMRVGHYGLGSLSTYKLFGLRLREAMTYEDPNKTVLQLIPHDNAKMAYLQYINPFEDYFIKLGANLLFCMNSGVDAILQPQYMLIGEPSLTGFSDAQMQYIQIITAQIHTPYPNGQLFVCSHAPVLNPVIKNAIQKGILKKLQRIPEFKIEDFKESRLRQLNEVDTRSDLDLDYHCGVLSNNWAHMIAFLDKNKGIALNGHTHYLREFRTKEVGVSNSIGDPDQVKPETTFAIYWDDYTQTNRNSSETLETLLPLHLQVPSLGFPNGEAKLQPGAFRTISIAGGRIKNLDVNFLKK